MAYPAEPPRHAPKTLSVAMGRRFCNGVIDTARTIPDKRKDANVHVQSASSLYLREQVTEELALLGPACKDAQIDARGTAQSEACPILLHSGY